MTPSNPFSPNSSNYYNLAIFICHLFIDGNFRTGHILHYPDTFEEKIIIEVDSICPYPIPWVITDATQTASVSWTPNDRTDHILQLVFLKPNHSADNINDFKDYFTFYHLFVFESSNETDLRTQLDAIKNKETDNFGSMVIHRNGHNGSIRVHWIYNDDIKMIYPQMKSSGNFFESTFGKYDETWLIAIKTTYEYPCQNIVDNQIMYYIKNGEPFIANFLQRQLRGSFINSSFPSCEKSNLSWVQRVIHHKNWTFYKELLPQNL